MPENADNGPDQRKALLGRIARELAAMGLGLQTPRTPPERDGPDSPIPWPAWAWPPDAPPDEDCHPEAEVAGEESAGEAPDDARAPGLHLVTMNEVVVIAASHIRSVGTLPSGHFIGLHVEDARDVRRCVYGLTVPQHRLWAVFVGRPTIGPGPSSVVLVEKVGGRVVYDGSAGDEG